MKNKVRKTFRKVALAVVVYGMAVMPLRAETLADTLVSAYENSGLLEQNRALLRAADEDTAQILAALRPIINYTTDYTRTFGTGAAGSFTGSTSADAVSIGVSLELLVFDGGQTRFQLEAAKETVLATREILRSVEQQVLLRAVAAYQDVRRNQEFVALRNNNLRVLRQELRAANDRFEVGEVTRTDVAQAEARVAGAVSQFAAAEGDLAQAVAEFRAAVGREPGVLRTPRQLPNLTSDPDASARVALQSHPDIRRAQHEVSAAELSVQAAGAATKPRVTVFGGYSATEDLGDEEFNRGGNYGVRATGPIYQGGLISSLKRQAMAQRDASRGNLHTVRKRIEQDVRNAYAILRAARAQRAASQEEVRAADVAFRGVREEATLGARTTLDVLDAEQELLDARANMISAEADVVVAAYQVLAALGQMTAKDLNLNVETYDPAAYYNLVKDAPVPISPQGQKLDRVLRALGKE